MKSRHCKIRWKDGEREKRIDEDTGRGHPEYKTGQSKTKKRQIQTPNTFWVTVQLQRQPVLWTSTRLCESKKQCRIRKLTSKRHQGWMSTHRQKISSAEWTDAMECIWAEKHSSSKSKPDGRTHSNESCHGAANCFWHEHECWNQPRDSLYAFRPTCTRMLRGTLGRTETAANLSFEGSSAISQLLS